MPMSSGLGHALSEFSKGRRTTNPLIDPPLHPTELELLESARSSRVKRATFAIARFLVVFCIGVTATLASQSSYGDAARARVATLFPRLGWLAPQAAPATQAGPAASAGASADQLAAISRGLAAVRQSVDKLAGDITRLQATRQETPNRASTTGVSTAVRKPVSPASQTSPGQ